MEDRTPHPPEPTSSAQQDEQTLDDLSVPQFVITPGGEVELRPLATYSTARAVLLAKVAALSEYHRRLETGQFEPYTSLEVALRSTARRLHLSEQLAEMVDPNVVLTLAQRTAMLGMLNEAARDPASATRPRLTLAPIAVYLHSCHLVDEQSEVRQTNAGQEPKNA